MNHAVGERLAQPGVPEVPGWLTYRKHNPPPVLGPRRGMVFTKLLPLKLQEDGANSIQTRQLHSALPMHPAPSFTFFLCVWCRCSCGFCLRCASACASHDIFSSVSENFVFVVCEVSSMFCSERQQRGRLSTLSVKRVHLIVACSRKTMRGNFFSLASSVSARTLSRCCAIRLAPRTIRLYSCFRGGWSACTIMSSSQVVLDA